VAKVEGKRSLTVGSAARCDPGGGAAQRTAPLSADREARQYRAATAPDSDPLIVDPDRSGVVLDARQCSKRIGARCKRCGEKPVLDVAAESIEPDLACNKSNFGRPYQPHGIIDDPQDAQRRGMFAALVPDAECVERAHRTC